MPLSVGLQKTFVDYKDSLLTNFDSSSLILRIGRFSMINTFTYTIT